LALILIAPAALFCFIGLVLPTVATITTSFQKVDLLSASEWVSGANYARLIEDKSFLSALGFTLSLVGVRLVAAAVVPLLLAWAVNEFGWGIRSGVRLLFTIPLALFGPVAAALAWLMALHPQFGLFGGEPPWLADPERAGWAIRLVDGLIFFGLACGLGLIVYLAALRGWDHVTSSRWKTALPLLVAWLISLLATAALTLPFFTLNFVMTNGGPANSTQTLALLQYQWGFQRFQFGPAATIATLTLVVVSLIGLGVALLIILSGLRLELASPGRSTGWLGAGRRPLALMLLILILGGSLSICAVGLLPLGWTALSSLKSEAEIFSAESSFFPASPSFEAYGRLVEIIPLGRVWVNTLVPPLVALLWQIPLVYAAALGIGALRPLGKWSEWLLLPFSPWLFVTITPLILTAFQNLREAESLNTFLALTPPILLNVPMLFILALFFKGQASKYSAAAGGGSKTSAFFRLLILPSLPLVILLAAATLLVNLQALLWPLVVANSPELQTFPVALLMLRAQFSTAWPILAAGVTLFQLPLFLLSFVVFGLLQVVYLDRLILITGATQFESGRK
jgi:ABC-type sugar transport system permease subunit